MLYIAADKYGYRTILFVEKFLKRKKLDYRNLGVTSDKEDLALQVFIPKIAKHIRRNKSNKAILSCGTGIGVDIGANRFSGIRSCLATNHQIARWSRVYDDCNCLCLAGWNTTEEKITKILSAWLSAKYDGNKARLQMFKAFDNWH
ncbi:MAG TPA: RpiB/LacA/LacB family sugar-phosphate isomerase [Candidatus Nanoarchaeia archaeon]|nr:RpiB/LacA/LacB family sugar-phosphate isomerase [Candidatus Nanoarchaeia archaeon]